MLLRNSLPPHNTVHTSPPEARAATRLGKRSRSPSLASLDSGPGTALSERKGQKAARPKTPKAKSGAQKAQKIQDAPKLPTEVDVYGDGMVEIWSCADSSQVNGIVLGPGLACFIDEGVMTDGFLSPPNCILLHSDGSAKPVGGSNTKYGSIATVETEDGEESGEMESIGESEPQDAELHAVRLGLRRALKKLVKLVSRTVLVAAASAFARIVIVHWPR
jgi:hypothetical protein